MYGEKVSLQVFEFTKKLFVRLLESQIFKNFGRKKLKTTKTMKLSLVIFEACPCAISKSLSLGHLEFSTKNLVHENFFRKKKKIKLLLKI